MATYLREQYAANNKSYLDFTGSYTGTNDKNFQIQVKTNGSSGAASRLVFRWRKQDAYADYTGDWSSWMFQDGSTAPETAGNWGTEIAVNTSYSLSDGMSIKFTRPDKNDYTVGDHWIFKCFSDLKLSNDVNLNYDYLESIDIGEDRNLLAISKETGDVAIIEGIDTDNPILSNTTTNIGSVNPGFTLDFEKKNKEVYIAKGKDKPPIWLGYNKNLGMYGMGENSVIKAEAAMPVVVSSTAGPNRMTFDRSVAFRAGATNSKDAKIIVGIKDEDHENAAFNNNEGKFYIYNIDDEHITTVQVPTPIRAIRKYYGRNRGSGTSAYCDGFVIMRDHASSKTGLHYGDLEKCIAVLDFYDLNSDTASGIIPGTQYNKIHSIYLDSPNFDGANNTGKVRYFHDFLVVGKYGGGLSTAIDDKMNVKFVLSAEKGSFEDWNDQYAHQYSWLWTVGGIEAEYEEASGNSANLALGGWDVLCEGAHLDVIDLPDWSGGTGDGVKIDGYQHSAFDDITPLTNETCLEDEFFQNPHGYTESTTNLFPIDGDLTKVKRERGWYWVVPTGVQKDNTLIGFGPQIYNPQSKNGTSDTTVGRTPAWYVVKAQDAQLEGVKGKHGIINVPGRHSLFNAGMDDTGVNPTIGWTCEYRPTISYNSGNTSNRIGAQWYDSSDVADQIAHKGRLSVPGSMSQDEARFWEITQGGEQGMTGPYFLDGDDACTGSFNASSYEPASGYNVDNINKQTLTSLRWVTHMIQPFNISGQGFHKMLSHTQDWTGNPDYDSLEKWQNATDITGSFTELLNNPTDGQGVFRHKAIPSVKPLFGDDGTVTVTTLSTSSHARKRMMFSYVRPGNRKYLSFRMGLEPAAPMTYLVTKGTYPMVDLFPNDWNTGTQNAYTNWMENSSLMQSSLHTEFYQSGTYFYQPTSGTNGSANARKRHYLQDYSEANQPDDDKNSYRMPETNWNIPEADWKHGGNNIVWYPENAKHQDVVWSVQTGNHVKEGIFYLDIGGPGSANATNTWLSGTPVDYFGITAPTLDSSGSWQGPSGAGCKTLFYRATLVLDGYQETVFLSDTAKLDGLEEATLIYPVNFSVYLEEAALNKRVTAVAIYRAYHSSDKTDPDKPDTLYRFLTEVKLRDFNWSDTNNRWEYPIKDNGDVEGTYEAINGIHQEMYNLHINYGVNATVNAYMFVGNCEHTEIEDADNYIFRSQPGKYSIFDWSSQFLQMPFVPIAMKGFQGKLYVFSENQTSVINPEGFYIEDTIEGIGCIGPKAMMVTDAGFIFADYRNIYVCTPQIQAVGDKILTVDTFGWSNLSTEVKSKCRLGYDAKRKAFLIFFSTSDSIHRVWAYSYRSGRWDLWETDKEVRDTLLTKDGATICLYSDNRIGKLLQDENNRYDWEWKSKKINMGTTMIDKKIRNIKIEANNRANTDVRYDVGGGFTQGIDVSTSFSGSNNTAIKLQNADKGKTHWVKARVTGDNGSGTDYKVHALSVIYKPKRAK